MVGDKALDNDPLPKPLRDLLDQCGDLTAAQRAQVKSLLCEYRDIFSCDGEIGHCPLVQHSIGQPPADQAGTEETGLPPAGQSGRLHQ